ncbi:IS66 family transposase [Bradyrhizobium elkanii]|uniref:IS66 family transposase n=1 Tax=Bradyrhizobium elkanii TaxID=29448 RepID=UPI003BA92AD6
MRGRRSLRNPGQLHDRTAQDRPLAPGSGSTKAAYLWAYARGHRTFGRERSPHGGLSLRGQPFRRMRGPASQWLYGILQVDGYAAYSKLAPRSLQ